MDSFRQAPSNLRGVIAAVVCYDPVELDFGNSRSQRNGEKKQDRRRKSVARSIGQTKDVRMAGNAVETKTLGNY